MSCVISRAQPAGAKHDSADPEGTPRSQSDVRTWRVNPACHSSVHERAAHDYFATELAKLKRIDFRGAYSADDPQQPGDSYFLPNATIVRSQLPGATGQRCTRGPRLADAHDLYGGVVPEAFIATKAISHGLLRPDCAQPGGWNESLAQSISCMTLRGFTAFTMADALRAGRELLASGPVRVKAVGATGGKGQWVAHDAHQLKRSLAEIEDQGVSAEGIVLEENLEQCVTMSIGQVSVAGHLISYHGTQYMTPDNLGGFSYGGSDLFVVRGGFEQLLALPLEPAQRLAIDQARSYHAAVQMAYPGFFASRINYDVAQGQGSRGWCSGVLEQSWRIGGATSAEVVALSAFDRAPQLQCIRASSGERYGNKAAIPAHAQIYYRGEDPGVGPITRYTCIEAAVPHDRLVHAAAAIY